MGQEAWLWMKILAAVVVGWKLGVLERKVEELINERTSQQ